MTVAEVQLILAIIGAVFVWTTSVIACVWWLNQKFRSLEAALYREVNRIKDAHNRLDRRLIILELNRNGVSEAETRL